MTIPPRARPQIHDDPVLKEILSVTSNPKPPVYAPSEDSLLIIEAVSNLNLVGKRVLDLGTGSGILGIFCAIHGATETASDIDDEALMETERAAKKLGVKVTLTVSDLFANIPGRFDLVLFNPPYLPSEGYEDRTVDGGPGGTVLVEKFLNELSSHLEAGAEAVLLLSSLNDPGTVQRRHRNFEFSVATKRKLFFEELQALRVRLRDDLAI